MGGRWTEGGLGFFGVRAGVFLLFVDGWVGLIFIVSVISNFSVNCFVSEVFIERLFCLEGFI